MTTRIFGSLDAQTEAERRVPPAGWSARESVLRDMARDLRSGAWRPMEDDMRRAAEFAYPPDTTPTAAEWLSAMED